MKRPKKKKKKNKKKPRFQISENFIYFGMSTFIALVAFISYFAQTEQSPIQTFEGRLSFYQFLSGGSKTSPHYTLTFPNKEFYISRVVIGALDKKKFIAEVKQGDQLKITYEDKNSILQIEKNGTTYLNVNTREEQRSGNTMLALIFGIACSLTSIYFLVRMIRHRKGF